MSKQDRDADVISADSIAVLRTTMPHAERLNAMVRGQLTSDDVAVVGKALRRRGPRISLDGISVRLLEAAGLNPAIAAYVAGYMPSLSLCVGGRHATWMDGLGRCSYLLDADHWTQWASHPVVGGINHMHDELPSSCSTIYTPRMPETMISNIAGMPLRKLFSHPVLDALDLTILDAAQGPRGTLLHIEAPWRLDGCALADGLERGSGDISAPAAMAPRDVVVVR